MAPRHREAAALQNAILWFEHYRQFWDASTLPEQLAKWRDPHHAHPTGSITVDLRPGGAFQFTANGAARVMTWAAGCSSCAEPTDA